MKKIISGICLLLFYASIALGQSTTMTIGTATGMKAGDTVSVPVNVSNFANVSSITLQIAYDQNVVDYVGISNSQVNYTAGASNGKLTLAWYDANNTINITSGLLLNLKFVYKGGSCNLDFTSVSEIANKVGQKITTVFNGGLIGNTVTLTLGAPTVSGSTYSVPLNVKDFMNIGSVTLKIKYDAGVLSYVNATNLPTKGQFLANATNGELIVSWFSTDTLNISSGKFVTLNFTYNGVGQTPLTFDQSACEVTNGTGIKMASKYVDALIGKVPTLTLAAPTVSGSTYSVPLNVKDFMNIGSVTLKIKYDAGVLSYVNATNLPTKGQFLANATNGELIVSWFSTDTLNISSGKFVTLNFTYNGVGQTPLTFDQSTCEVTNGLGVKIGANFVDGTIGTVPTLTLAAPTVSGSSVSVPLNVKDFKNIGSATLKIKYDAGVLSYVNATNLPTKGQFLANATNGELIVSWFSTDTLNISSGKFVTLNFTYNGVGQSALSFDKDVCEITNGAGVKIAANYVDVLVGKVPALSFGSATINGKNVSVPLNVKDFVNMGSATLAVKFDPSVLTFVDATNKPSKGQFLANATNGALLMSWFSTDSLNISNGTFVTLNFTTNGGFSQLAFSKSDCELTNVGGVKVGASYADGYVGKAASIIIAKKAVQEGQDVTVPVYVKNFKNVGAITLNIGYNSNVLEFKNASGSPAGQFLSNASNGEIKLSWMNTTPFSSDSAIFVNLNFHYNAGQTDITVNDATSELADAIGSKVFYTFTNGSVELVVAPTFTTEMKDATIKEGAKYTFAYKVNDPNKLYPSNQYPLVYSLVNKPAGAAIDSLTGVFTWTPDFKAAQTDSGKYKVSIQVAKGKLFVVKSSTVTLTVTDVNQAPVFTVVPKDTTLWLHYGTPHDPYVQTYKATYKAVDPDGDKVTYAIVAGPYGAKINDSTGVFEYTLKAGQKLLNKVQISAKDSKGGIAIDTAEFKIDIMTAVEPTNGIPTEYSLNQNYPNPFNPTTYIQYSIPKESKVSLKVYNLIGQEVAVLVNQVQATGYYKVNFNANSLPSGIYIYRLDAGTYKEVRKMTLLK